MIDLGYHKVDKQKFFTKHTKMLYPSVTLEFAIYMAIFILISATLNISLSYDKMYFNDKLSRPLVIKQLRINSCCHSKTGLVCTDPEKKLDFSISCKEMRECMNKDRKSP